MKKVIIFGASGMAGHTIDDYLKSTHKYIVYTIGRENDYFIPDFFIKNIATDLKYMETIITNIKPDIIINCIGMLVKGCDEHIASGIFLNSYFPHWLSKFSAKIIHLSTDCVFNGKRGLYKDTDEKDGKSQYAKAKSLGEIINNKDLTIRMSIIGKELKENGTGLFEWFMKQKGEITGYDKVYWTGITTLELAKAIDKLINTNFTGLYQLAFPYKISKYELIKLIKNIWKKDDVTIIESCDKTCDKSLINSSQSIPNYKMPLSYKQMLGEYYAYCQLRYKR